MPVKVIPLDSFVHGALTFHKDVAALLPSISLAHDLERAGLVYVPAVAEVLPVTVPPMAADSGKAPGAGEVPPVYASPAARASPQLISPPLAPGFKRPRGRPRKHAAL
jgi:AT hook motif